MSLDQYRSAVARLSEAHRRAMGQVRLEQEGLDKANGREATALDAQDAVQRIAQEVQIAVHERISSVVRRCLEAVFEDPYGFRIRFDRRRGKTEARLVFDRDGREYDDPLNQVGGGVIDVAALALRLACVTLARPRLRKLLVLDEPFSKVRGAGNRARTRGMLLALAEELGFQIILCTDIPEYRVGTVVEMGT